MKKWLQRIRGAVGMGLTWAAAWFGVSMILLSGLVVFGVAPVGVGLAAVAANAVVFAAFGFIGGTIFSTVLGITEGRRRFDEMSLPRFGAWGALGGFLLPALVLITPGGLTLTNLVLAGIVTLLGAGSAAGSLALARRAEDSELLESGEEALGLTEGG